MGLVLKAIRLIAVVTLTMVGGVSISKANPVVRLAVDVSENIPNQVGLVSCVFDQIGFDFEVLEMPWKRAQIATEHGSVDGFFIAARTAERDSYAVYSSPLRKIKWFYVTRRGFSNTPEQAAFYDSVFASMRGTRRLQWLKAHLAEKNSSTKVIAVNTPERGLLDLVKGEVDVVLTNSASFENSRSNFENSEEIFDLFPVREVEGAVYFGKQFVSKNPDFLSEYNSKAEACRSDQ